VRRRVVPRHRGAAPRVARHWHGGHPGAAVLSAGAADLHPQREQGAGSREQLGAVSYCSLLPAPFHSTVTDFARFLGLSTSQPRNTAMWYASSCSGSVVSTGDKSGAVAGTR